MAAEALTSTTGTVVSSDVTFTVPKVGQSRGDGVIAYIDFTKNGDTLVISTSFNDDTIDTNFYTQIYLDGSFDLQNYTININSTGKYRIPIPIAANEDSVKLSCAGLVSGTLNIEFVIDQPYK